MNRAISPFRFRSRGTTLAVTAAAVLPSPHADAPSRGPRTRSTARGGRLARPVLDRAAFESLIVRERKRTDRSSEAFLLGRLVLDSNSAITTEASREAAIAAIGRVTRAGDVLGWLEPHRVLGVLMPEIHGDIPDAGKLTARLTDAVASPARASRTVPIGLHVYPAQRSMTTYAACPEPRPFRSGRELAFCAVKRILDVAGSLLLLLLLAPVFLLIAALVKATSPGPVLFRQLRVGYRGRPFVILKFRTMYVSASHALHDEYVTWFIRSSSRDGARGNGGLFKITRDPRVTPIGRVLRKSSLDELPQLWNVLRGDMSLVGPRPPIPFEVEQYQPWHLRRVMDAKPGITGLWQVVGRSRTTFDEMVRLDLRYARRSSLWMDIKILLATPAAVISGKGAC